MSQVCRTCLKIVENKSQVFNIEVKEPTHDIVHIKAKLEACVPEIVLNRVKNSVICNYCLCALNTAYDFKTKCLESEKKIYHFVKYSTNDGIDLNKFITKIEPYDQSNNNVELSSRLPFGQTEPNLSFNSSTHSLSKSFQSTPSALYPTNFDVTSQHSPAPAPTSPFFHQAQNYSTNINSSTFRVPPQAVFQTSQPFSSHYSSQNIPSQRSNGSSPSILHSTLLNRPRHQSLDPYNPTYHPRYPKANQFTSSNQSNYPLAVLQQLPRAPSSFNSDSSNQFSFYPYPPSLNRPLKPPSTVRQRSPLQQRSPFPIFNSPPLAENQNAAALHQNNPPSLPILNPPSLAEFQSALQPSQEPESQQSASTTQPATPIPNQSPLTEFSSPPPDIKPILPSSSPKNNSASPQVNVSPSLQSPPPVESTLIEQPSVQQSLIQQPVVQQLPVHHPSFQQDVSQHLQIQPPAQQVQPSNIPSSLASLLLQPSLDHLTSNQQSNNQSSVFSSSNQPPPLFPISNQSPSMQPPQASSMHPLQLSSLHPNRNSFTPPSPFNRPSNFNSASPMQSNLARFNHPSAKFNSLSSTRFTPPPSHHQSSGKFDSTPPLHQSSFNFPPSAHHNQSSEFNSNSSMYSPSFYPMSYNNASGHRPSMPSGDSSPMFHSNLSFHPNFTNRQHFSSMRPPMSSIRPHLSSIRPHLSSIRSSVPSPPPQNLPPLFFPPSSTVSSFLQAMRPPPSQNSSFLQHPSMYRLPQPGPNAQIRLFNPNFASLNMNGMQDRGNQPNFSHQMNKPPVLLCPICGRNFVSKELLDQHMTIHTFKCDPCNFLTTSNESYIEHLSTHKTCDNTDASNEKPQEPIDQVYKCTTCNYNTQDKASYEEHTISHKSEYFYKCQLCTFKTIHSYSLRRHMKVHSTVTDSIYKCNQCAFECDKDNLLKDHMIKFHSEKVSNAEAEEELVQVEPYQVSIDDIQNIFQDDHESNDEGEKEELLMENESELMDDSDSYMITAADLEKILKEEPSDDLESDATDSKSKSSDFELGREDGGDCNDKSVFKCSVCNQPFQFKYQLKKHMIIHSVTKKILECKMCEYRTTTKSHLQVHIATHTGGKIYRCDQCSYCTVYFSNLEKHNRVHTGEKPYKCDYCDYSVTKLSRLKNHLNNHAKQKLYTCKECFYEADSEENLLSHKEIHSMGKHFLEDPVSATSSNLS